jgi:hypothetical protein
MSRSSFKSSKTVTDFPGFKIGNLSEAISSAFGNPLSVPKPPSEPKKPKLSNLKTKQIGKELFLTEAEMNEIEEQKELRLNEALSYEEMIQEVDAITYGIKTREDDLVELRKRIARCQAGISTQETQYEGLHKSAKELKAQNKTLMKKFKSVSNLSKIY